MDTTTPEQKCIKDAEMDVIRDFVYRFREQRGIYPRPYEQRISLSGEHFGEGLVTLYQGLIPTTESLNGHDKNGLWASLDDTEIRHMVLKQVVKDQYVLRK